MKGILSLLLIIAVAFCAYWFLTKREPLTLENAQHEVAQGARKLGDAIDDLDTKKLKEELSRTGKIVRENSSRLGNAVKDASADARITSAIKMKLAADPDLSAVAISVNTTDGLVTLSGNVPSDEALSKAIRLALATEGVRRVESTLQVRPSQQ
jgi:osmotically-inducible protein OsmY